MNDTNLFSEFPKVSAKQWKQQIQFDLKGADYNDTLVWESNEGIHVKPFYTEEDIKEIPSFKLPDDHTWKIAQNIYAGDARKANEKALEVLSKGVESLFFTIPNEDVDFKTLLSNIDIARVPLHFDFHFLALEPIQNLVAFLKGKKSKVHLHIDSIGHLARNGNWHHNLEEDYRLLEKIHSLLASNSDISAFGIDMALYQNAGANIVQQLAYGLSHANEYLNRFVASSRVEKSSPITFKVAVGSNYFFEIAKLRALRWLWQSLLEEYGIHGDCHILAMPTKRNKTLYDYNVNMLRTTSECMSAILGGTDTVCSLPYDVIYHKNNEFGERIARNQLLLLKEESYMEAASKISEGSYYIESLTEQLAQKALALFKQIEASGGFLNSLKKGTIQDKIKESAEKEQIQFDAGNLTLVGTNKFQNPGDRMKENLELYPFVKQKPRKTLLVPIIEKRLAEDIEQKRLEDE